ncbi:hypothetical protein AAYO93_02315 [Diaminobutyricibacter sp. McL0608]
MTAVLEGQLNAALLWIRIAADVHDRSRIERDSNCLQSHTLIIPERNPIRVESDILAVPSHQPRLMHGHGGVLAPNHCYPTSRYFSPVAVRAVMHKVSPQLLGSGDIRKYITQSSCNEHCRSDQLASVFEYYTEFALTVPLRVSRVSLETAAAEANQFLPSSPKKRRRLHAISR